MNRICQLFNIRYPIVSGGMVWCSGWNLASTVSEAGGLGLIGAGSMHPEVLREHIRKCRAATKNPFGVNVSLMYPNLEEIMHILVDEEVKIVFTSAGNPGIWTPFLKEKGIKVAHVISNSKFAMKAAEAGVDAIVAEGFEAGGHNGREETTTLVLIPQIRQAVSIPLLAAGGIGSGSAILAVQVLGAEGVQIGSLFASSIESSAHSAYKQKIIESREGDTLLMLKALTPVRMLRNPFFDEVKAAESKGESTENLRMLLGKGRAKCGMFEGNMQEGQLEIGQISAMIQHIEPVQNIMNRLVREYHEASTQIHTENW